MNNYEIITLCGSSKFKKEFMDVAKDLTLQGKIVFSLEVFTHADTENGETLTHEIRKTLDEVHKVKIEMSDAIYVINPNGYIGESTREEILFAESLGKKIYYLEPLKYTYKGYVDRFIALLQSAPYDDINHGDVYLVKFSEGYTDTNNEPIRDMQFVVYNKIAKGWYCINLKESELIIPENNKVF